MGMPSDRVRRFHSARDAKSLEYSIVASGILRFMCPVPSETAKHVPWHSGLNRTQKPAEMDQMWTKWTHAHPDGAHANQAASGQRPAAKHVEHGRAARA